MAIVDDHLLGTLKGVASGSLTRLTELSPAIKTLQADGLIEIKVQFDVSTLRKFYLVAITSKGRLLLESCTH